MVKPSPRRQPFVLKVTAPRKMNDREFMQFTSELNAQLSKISGRFGRLPELDDFEPDDFVRKHEFESFLDEIEQVEYGTTTSEGEESGVGQGRGTSARQRRSSRRRRFAEEAAEAVISGAAPDAAPPEVEDASSIGTTTSPLQFALEDHTHSGVNLGDPQTITGLKTFDRDPGAPFAVTAGSASVTNLSSDFLDGLDATFFAWLTGQTGGQVLRGGTGAGEDLTFSSTIHATKGNVFIGITSEAFSYDETNNRLGLAGAVPNTRLDIAGDFAIRSDDVTVVAGANNDLAIGEFSTIRLVGGGGAFNVSGFTDGFDGKLLIVHNTTADAWTITNLAGSAAANQIQTLTGADVVLAAGPSIAYFYYDGTQSNWILISARDSTGAV